MIKELYVIQIEMDIDRRRITWSFHNGGYNELLFLFQTHNTVSYTEQHYDAKHNLVSFRFAPRTHSPSAIFFARFIMSTTFPNEAFNIIHDFDTQLQYTINER